MRFQIEYSFGKLLFAGVLGVLVTGSLSVLRAQDMDQQADPPSRVARVSLLTGNVSIQPASVEQFNVAEPNYPMTTGDRIYTDSGATAEIQTGQIAVRLGQQTDLTVTAMTDDLAQFGLARGSVHLRTYNVYQGETVELDTPNVAVTVLQAGDVRVDVDPENDVTLVTVLTGQVQVNGNGVEQIMEPGERLRLSGGNPVYAQLIGASRPDGLDRFSAQRDGVYLSAFAEEGQYLNPGTIGGEDLAAYGSWENEGELGPVWYPANVDYNWQPYRNGHWTWVAPWGWTWVEAEPWGFAPFHYGRWNRFGNRWGWIPGPAVVRPVYSPALVAFVGGGGFSAGITAWFPLGPREVYTPWYHVSDRYVNRVNVSNIYDRDVVNVRNIYNQRTVVNVYSTVNVTNRVYVNRNVATVAMQQDNFARGGRADQSNVRVDARQLGQAQVVPHPLVTPERQMVAQAPARAVPAMQQRPVLASHEDNRVGPGAFNRGQSFGQGNAQTVQTQGRPSPVQGNPVQGQTVQGQGGFRGGQQAPVQAPQQTAQPQSRAPQQPAAPVQAQPTQPNRPQSQTPQMTRPVAPTQPGQEMHCPGGCPEASPAGKPATAPQPLQRQVTPAPQPAQQPQRPLFNQAVPPQPRVSFEQQRQAIQATDPGRPLSPQQMNNVRQNQPAGPPERQEQPHPAGPPALHNEMQHGIDKNPH